MPESIEVISKLVNGRVFGRTTAGLAGDSQLSPESSDQLLDHWKDYSLLDAMPLQDARAGDLTLVDSLLHLAAWIASPAVVAFAPIAIAEELFNKSQVPPSASKNPEPMALATGGALIDPPSHKTSKPEASVYGSGKNAFSSGHQKIIIGVDNLHQSFETAIVALRGERGSKFCWHGIHPTAVIHPTAQVAASANIGPYVTVAAGCTIGERTCIHSGVQIAGHCTIAEDCEIFSNAVLYQGTILYPRVMLHASSVLGAYGFGYRQCDNVHVRTAQLGWVEVESDVEIGAGTTIDRGTYGPTRIGRGTKLDNQIQIGHNVHIGEHNLLCAQVGIAGSSSTGSYVVLGGQVGVRDHLRLGDRTMAAAQAGIAMDVPDGESVLGSPALPQREATQMWIHSRRLPEIRKQIKTLESQMKSLMQQMESLSFPEPIYVPITEPMALATGGAPNDSPSDKTSKPEASTYGSGKKTIPSNPVNDDGTGLHKRVAA